MISSDQNWGDDKGTPSTMAWGQSDLRPLNELHFLGAGMAKERIMLTGSVTGQSFVLSLVSALKNEYELYADFVEQESFNFFYPDINSNIQRRDYCRKGPPASLRAIIRLCTLTNVDSELSALNKNITNQWVDKPKTTYIKRLNSASHFICILPVKKPEDHLVVKAVEAKLIELQDELYKCTCLFILGNAKDQLSSAILSACDLILNTTEKCLITKLSILKSSDKPDHGPTLPGHIKPALKRNRTPSSVEDQPYFILTGQIERKCFAPSFVRALLLNCNLICDVKDSQHLRVFCPEVQRLSYDNQPHANPPGVAGVIRICSSSEGELGELQEDIVKYSPMIPDNGSGIFICISLTCDRLSRAKANAIRAHLANAKLKQLNDSTTTFPIRFTSLLVLSKREVCLGEALASACLHIMLAPPHVAITNMSLTSFEDLSDYDE